MLSQMSAKEYIGWKRYDAVEPMNWDQILTAHHICMTLAPNMSKSDRGSLQEIFEELRPGGAYEKAQAEEADMQAGLEALQWQPIAE